MSYNVTFLPSIFHVESGGISQVGEILRDRGIGFDRILIITGRSHSAEWGRVVAASISGRCRCEAVRDATDEEVTRVHGLAEAHQAGLLVAVGGGVVIDVAKRISRLFNIPVVVVPTVVANDGLMSPISVLKGQHGRGQSLPASMPIGIIADLDVIMAAPVDYLRAAAGDLLSNLSATSDWRRMVGIRKGPRMNDVAFHMSLGAAESVVFSANPDFADIRFVRSLVVGQIYSGIAMALAGSSRPCSGPEHLISHAIDELGLAPGIPHGLQVGSICQFVLDLLGELSPSIADFTDKVGIPASWLSIAPAVADNLPRVIEHARRVRPDRRTFLDEWSDRDLVRRAIEHHERSGGGALPCEDVPLRVEDVACIGSGRKPLAGAHAPLLGA